VEGMTSGQGIEVHGNGWLIQAFPSQKETHMFIYKRIPSTTTKIPFSSKVTDEDIAEFYDAKLTPQVAFKDIWDKRYAQGTANFEEGVCNLWHYDRIAMVGDAVHKASIIPVLLFVSLQANNPWDTDFTEARSCCKCRHGSCRDSNQ
jgi:2-polyprenyl-6-methoxyphenol hydroxylase-like FAD-dependent oxidoreductase